MSTLKECKVVMLPTKDKSTIKKSKFTDKLDYSPAMILIDEHNWQPQHLYILSDDEIKEGDWYYKPDLNQIFKAEYTPGDKNCKKIIATTDKSLKYALNDKRTIWHDTLPEPSQGFVKKYCEKGGIDKVMVEYEGYKVNGMIDEATSYRLKISVDNTITIKPIKNSWNREEVEALIWSYSSAVLDTTDPFLDSFEEGNDKNADTFTKDWIKQNL